MKINLTRKQYRTLLKVFYLGEWMLNSSSTSENPETEDLEQHILSFAETYDCTDWIEKDKEEGIYYATQQMESDLDEYIEEYEEDRFWERLTHQLARRDYFRNEGMKSIKEKEPDEIIVEIEKIAEKYKEEFEKNGLLSLMIAKQFNP